LSHKWRASVRRALLQSPLIVGIAVFAADPGGLFGMLKESMASARALVQAKADPNVDELVRAVAGDFETSEGRGLAQEGVKAVLAGTKPADIKAKAVAKLSAVSALLANKAPADAVAYKTWLAGIAKGYRGSSPRTRLSRLRRRAGERYRKGEGRRHRDGARRPGARSVAAVHRRGPGFVALLRDGREASTSEKLSNGCGRALTNDRSTCAP